MVHRIGREGRCGAALLVAILWGMPVAAAQVQIQIPQGRVQPVFRGKVSDSSEAAHLPTDRSLSRGLARAEESIASGNFSEAIRFLDEVLGGVEDSFVETGQSGGFLGLKEAASGMLRDLPPAGREAYLTLCGPISERLLREALQRDDAEQLQRIASRYFNTPAGLEAAYVHALREADAGRHLAAALAFRKLRATPEARERFDPELSLRAASCWLAAGDRDEAQRVLMEIVAGGDVRVSVAGGSERLDRQSASLAWLRAKLGTPARQAFAGWENWLAFRRDASRSGQAPGGLPHMRERWKVRLLHPRLAPVFDRLANNFEQAGESPPVAASPLAIGDTVLIRTPHQLLAVDFESGKRVWQVEVQPAEDLDQLVQQARTGGEQGEDQQAIRGFAQQMWQDYLYQLVSSDGERVFVIGDLEPPIPSALESWPGRFDFQGSEVLESNRLTAFDLATQGKRVWEIDGAVPQGELAGAFFLGAPTSLGNLLYVLVEIKGAIYLVAVEGSSGEVAWRQQLVGLEVGVALDPLRRLQALMPSYEGGILVCPTSAGVVVGVDLASRSLAWAYRYEVTQQLPWGGREEDRQFESSRHWLNPIPTLSAGRVVLTPPESPSVHCLDLQTGKLLWKQPRGEMCQVAAIDDEVLVLAGSRRLTALRLDDGKPAWEPLQTELEPGTSISGSGFSSGPLCYLPLSSAEVVALDMRSGRIVDRARAGDGQALGNLISHRGALISHNGLALQRYDQVDLLRKRAEERLATSASDVDSLRTLGEIAYNEGRLAEAADLLVEALRLAPDDYEVRRAFSECLTAALDHDFPRYRSFLPQLERIQRDFPGGRIDVLRIKAEGLLAAGEPLAAAEACLEVYLLGDAADHFLEISRSRRTMARRWARAELAAIWRASDAAQQQQLAAQVSAAMERLNAVTPEEATLRNSDFFADLPIGDQLRLQLARDGLRRGLRLGPQLLLMQLQQSSDPAISREAVARHAALLHEADHGRQAIDNDRLLLGALADVPCLDGLTGRECVQSWGGTDLLPTWPHGRVEVVSMAPSRTTPTGRRRSPEWGIRLERTDEILGRCTVLNMARTGEVFVRDSCGRELFRSPLEGNQRIRYPESNRMYGVSRGSLLVLSTGRQLIAMNTISAGDNAEPPVLWRAAVTSRLQSQRVHPSIDRIDIGQRPGSYRAPRVRRDGLWSGVIGPVTAAGCVYQDQRLLVCADPITGQELWSRSDVPAGCDLFGDDQVVFATPPGSRRTLLFGAIDGRSLGEVETPLWDHQLVTRGREVIVWKPAGRSGYELSAIDALTQTTIWRYDFHSGAEVDVAEARYALVAEPNGRTTIVDLVDGSLLADYRHPTSPVIRGVHLLAGSDVLLAVIERPRSGGSRRGVKSFIPVDYPVIDGQVLAFSRGTGEMLWNRPAEIDQQALMLTQPVDLPMLIFLGTIEASSRGSRSLLTLLALDKATGQTLYRTDQLPPSGGGYCEARIADDPGDGVWIETATRTLQFRFTGRARPPLPPAMAEVEVGRGQGSRGLLGILQNGIIENMRQQR